MPLSTGRYVAFLRGINVGGKNLLPMAKLVAVLRSLGLEDVRTYVQSGNVVFASRGRSSALVAKEIREAIAREQGFEPWVIVLTAAMLERAMASNPFPEAEAEPTSLHLFFLDESPRSPDLERLEGLRTRSERFALADRVFYLHAPDGIGRSKLAANVERTLGVPATARNWRTVAKVMELARDTG